jgi:hypothetical protein
LGCKLRDVGDRRHFIDFVRLHGIHICNQTFFSTLA